MRFFDLLLERGKIPEMAKEAVIFDASEIAREIDRIYIESPEAYSRESFGFCAPPFRDRYFWIEALTELRPEDYDTPGDRINMELSGITQADLERSRGSLVYRGALCLARERDKGDPAPLVSMEGEYPSGRWEIVFTGYLAVRRPGEIGESMIDQLPAFGSLVIGQDGSLLTDPNRIPSATWSSGEELRIATSEAMANITPFLLMALSFLHRRTEVDYISPNRLERKNAARALGKRSGALPLRDYYLLRIKPHSDRENPLTDLSEIRPLRSQAKGERRSHRVRGHFRRVPDSGLFGRGYNAGELLWIPDHTRGDPSFGEVTKGYKISREG